MRKSAFLAALLLAFVTLLSVRAENSEAEKALGDGIGALWNKQYAAAVAAYSRAIALDPNYVLAYCSRCDAYEEEGQFGPALADANRAIALDPKSGIAYMTRANVYLDLRAPKNALPDLNQSIARHPLAVTFYRRAEAHYALGEYDLAIKDYTQAISPTAAPGPPDTDILDNSTAVIDLAKEMPYYYRGLAHQKMGQFEEAEADLRNAAELDPDVAARLAQEPAKAGTPTMAQAVQAYASALDDEPSDDGAYFNSARPGFPEHDFPAALTNLDTVVAQDPNNVQARRDRAYAEYKLNDYAKSVDDNQVSFNLRPGNPSVYNNRGLLYLTTGEFDRAIDDYNEVIRLLYLGSAPADAHREALAYCGLGKALGLKGDDVNAKVCFNLAAKFAPDLALVYRFRADYEAAEGKDAEALADYLHAVQLNPKSAEALSGEAWLLATSKVSSVRNPNEAVADASKACDLTAWNDPDMLSVLAAASAAAGDFPSAQKWENQAVAILDHEPDHAADAEAKRLLGLYQAQKTYAAPQ